MTEQSAIPVTPPDLDTLEGVADTLGAAFDAGDADLLLAAMATVARADGVAHLAAAAGLSRAALSDGLASGALPFDTTLAIMKVIDLHRSGAPN